MLNLSSSNIYDGLSGSLLSILYEIPQKLLLTNVFSIKVVDEGFALSTFSAICMARSFGKNMEIL